MEAHGAQPSEERYVHKRDREERGGKRKLEMDKWANRGIYRNRGIKTKTQN